MLPTNEISSNDRKRSVTQRKTNKSRDSKKGIDELKTANKNDFSGKYISKTPDWWG